MKKVDAVTEVRTNAVLDLILGGCHRRDILNWVTETAKWEIGERQVDRLISRAHKAIEKTGEVHREYELGKHSEGWTSFTSDPI